MCQVVAKGGGFIIVGPPKAPRLPGMRDEGRRTLPGLNPGFGDGGATVVHRATGQGQSLAPLVTSQLSKPDVLWPRANRAPPQSRLPVPWAALLPNRPLTYPQRIEAIRGRSIWSVQFMPARQRHRVVFGGRGGARGERAPSRGQAEARGTGDRWKPRSWASGRWPGLRRSLAAVAAARNGQSDGLRLRALLDACQ